MENASPLGAAQEAEGGTPRLPRRSARISVGGVASDGSGPQPILRISIPSLNYQGTPGTEVAGKFVKAPARRRSSLSWHSRASQMSDAPHTPSSTCPPIEDWTLYVNWVDGIDDLRRGRRYEREGRILKKRPEADGDDSHSDGEMEVLNREENVDFDPEVDPAELPLIVLDPELAFGMNERERLMLMNSHLPENKGPNTFTLSLRKMVNGAPPPPRATKKRNLLKAIVTTSAQDDEAKAAAADAASPAAAAPATAASAADAAAAEAAAPEGAAAPSPSPSPSIRKPGNAPSRFTQRGEQPEEVKQELRQMGRFARVGKYMVIARRFHARLMEFEQQQHGLSSGGSEGGSQHTSPGLSPRLSPRFYSVGGSHVRGSSDCGPPTAEFSGRISAPLPSKSMANIALRPAEVSPLSSLLPPELLPTLVPDGAPLPPVLQAHASVPGLLSPLLRMQMQQAAQHSAQQAASGVAQTPTPPIPGRSRRNSHNSTFGSGHSGRRTSWGSSPSWWDEATAGGTDDDAPWPPHRSTSGGSAEEPAGAGPGSSAPGGGGGGGSPSSSAAALPPGEASPGPPGVGFSGGEKATLARVSEGGGGDGGPAG